jgi:lysophospholipase L1-like esterase
MLLATLGLIGACSASPARPAPPPTPLPPQAECEAAHSERHLCILILGDSIADGTPLTGDDRWWVRLESKLSESLPDRDVIVDSWAVPGSRVDVLQSAAEQASLPSYDLALVIEGVNDAAATPLDEWQRRYARAIETLERRGLHVILATPPPTLVDGAFTERYEPTTKAIRQVAGRHLPLVDIAEEWRSDGAAVAGSYYADLIHQSAAGQARMADLAIPVIVGIVRELAS